MKVYQYINAHDLSKWVSKQYGINQYDVYDTLLDNDYIEGSMGSRWDLEYAVSEADKGDERAKWYAEFLMEFDMTEIQLKYG